jgi:hypothetical protein
MSGNTVSRPLVRGAFDVHQFVPIEHGVYGHRITAPNRAVSRKRYVDAR